MPRGSAPGERRGGRQKGTPNKATTAVKEALEAAFEGIGGVTKLISWAKEEPTEFFRLWAKLLPSKLEASGPDGGPIEHKDLNYDGLTKEERNALRTIFLGAKQRLEGDRGGA